MNNASPGYENEKIYIKVNNKGRILINYGFIIRRVCVHFVVSGLSNREKI